MDARRVLLLVICIINGTFANQNGWGPNNVRRIRKINEYLVPPPPPRFHPPGRIPRLANFQSTPPPGYFTMLMKWLNPFSSESSLQPPPPPPLSPQPKALYPPKFIQPAPLPSATIYNGPPPVAYEKPPLSSFSMNDHSGYPVPIKIKNCNSCNKVPWMPIQHGAHSEDASYAPPPFESSDGKYLSKNHEIPHDAYHAASQEVRAPNFPFAPPLPNGQDGLTAPLHPHLFPGAMPPLFKAGDFNYPVQVAPDENSGYLDSPPSSVSGASIGNSSFLDAGVTFNGGHNGQSVYPDSSVHSGLGIPQEVEYTNPGASNGEFENFHQDHAAHGDLSSSSTQVSQGHANSIPDKQGLESTNADLFDSINHQTSLSDSVSNRQPLEVSNNGEFYDATGSSGLLGGFLDNASQTNQNLPSYGISGLDRVPDNYEHQHNDLSFSASVAEDNSRALLHTSDESSRKIADSINFEESPLLDFTHKDESRTHSSSIPSTSNAFADFESAKIAGTTVTPGDEIFGTRQGIASTESYLPTNYLKTIDTMTKKSKINDSITQDMKNIREQDVSPSNKAKDLWSNVPSVSISIDRESSGNVMLKPYDNETKEILSDNINLDEKARQQGAKKNKQVQVIIPYTSQDTPHPFYPSHGKNIDTDESNHDNYIGEESRNRIEVVSPPNSSHIFQSWPTTLAIFEVTTKKPIIKTKTNNFIDVHNLQKNIDDWTIEEYSKNISTASTASPSSGNPYLFPSKKIPNEYFMTTESIDHVVESHNDNIKTITLNGFSFNDQEYKESVDHRTEGSREQVIKIEKSTESSTNAPTTPKNMWRDFPVGISSDKERVYIVTPQPIVTTSSLNSEYRQEKALKEAERSRQESKKISQIDTKKTKKSDTFELIEKAYQVLPQAVNNLAVASTGPESVPLWSIMEHEEFASPVDNDYDNNDTESPMLYSKLSKESRARR